MANGEVSIVADLNTKKVEEAITKLEKHISTTTEKMGTIINKFVSETETKLKGIGSGLGTDKGIKVQADTTDVEKQYKKLTEAQKEWIRSGSNTGQAFEGTRAELKLAAQYAGDLADNLGINSQLGSRYLAIQKQITASLNAQKVASLTATQQTTASSIGSGQVTNLQNYSVGELQEMVRLSKQVETNYALGSEELKNHQQFQENVNRALKEQAQIAKQTPTLSTTQLGALDEGTINKNTAKIKEYQRALKDLDITTEAGRKEAALYRTEMNRLNAVNKQALGSTESLRASTSRLGNAFENLGSRIIAYTVYASLGGFVRQMIDIRGQFEQTQIALGAMLDDVDEAQRQFDLIQQQALKSPFSIMELTTATKQLAAYNIEVEKINPTMQMLADVSAGVAVPMERLVYNFGQIRAQTVLNGRELRDFANAGVPVLQELADMYTEVQGRMVTTGEVFDMVSNRMVSFQDVEQVFQRLTSEGGIFFNMQIELAESLRGRISNLQDAYQIMLNAIGESSQGVLGSAIEAVTQLMTNWGKVASVLKVVVLAYGAYKSAMLLSTLAMQSQQATEELTILSKQRSAAMSLLKTAATKKERLATLALVNAEVAATQTTTILGGAMKALSFINPFTLILTALAGVVTYLVLAKDETKELRKELAQIGSEGEQETTQLINRFKQLTNVINDSTASAVEQKEAYATLKNVFGDILPQQALEINNLKNQTDGYNALTTAIRNNTNARTLEKQMAAVTESYTERINKAYNNLSEDLSRTGGFWRSTLRLNETDTKAVLSRIRQEMEDLTFNMADPYKELMRIVRAETENFAKGVDMSELQAGLSDLIGTDNLQEYLGVLAEYSSELKETKSSFDRLSLGMGRYSDLWLDAKRQSEAFVKAEVEAREAAKWREEVVVSDFEFKFDVNEIKLKPFVDATNNILKKAGINFTVTPQVDVFNDKDLNQQIAKLDTTTRQLVQRTLSNFSEMQGELVPTKAISQMVTNFEEASKKTKVGLDDVSQYLRTNEQDYAAWSKEVLGAKETLERLNAVREAENKARPEGETKLFSDKTIAETEREIAFLDEIIAKYGLIEDKKRTSDADKEGLQNLRLQLAMVNEITKAYRESGGDAEKVKAIYAGMYDDIFKGQGKLSDLFTFDDSNILAFIQGLEAIGDDAIELLVETTTKMKVELLVENNEESLKVAENELNKLFQNYQVGVDIDTNGAVGGFLADLLGIDKVDFSELEAGVKKLTDDIYKMPSVVAIQADITEQEKVVSSDTATEEEKKDAQARIIVLKALYAEETKLATKANADLKKIREEDRRDRYEYYANLLTDNMDYQERRVQAAKEANAKIAALEADTTIEDADKTKIKAGIEAEKVEAVASINLEEAESSELWKQAFGDTEDIADKSIQPIIDMLQKMSEVAGLPIEDIERLQDKIAELQDLRIERNPFEALSYNAIELKNAIEQANIAKQNFNNITADENSTLAERDEAERLYLVSLNKVQLAQNKQEQNLNAIITQYSNLSSASRDVVGGFKDLAAVFGDELGEGAEKALDVVDSIIEMSTSIVPLMTDVVTNASEGMSTAAGLAAKSISTVEKASVILAVISAALQVATAIGNLFGGEDESEVLDANIESVTGAITNLEKAIESLSSVQSTYASSGSAEWDNMRYNINASREAMLALTDDVQKPSKGFLGLGGVVSDVLGMFGGLGDLVYDIGAVGFETLGYEIADGNLQAYAYSAMNAVVAIEEFQKAVDKAEEASKEYGVAYIEGTAATVAGIEAQNAELQTQIDMEKSRRTSKGDSATDWAKVAEYEQQQLENLIALEEAQRQLAETMFGTSAVSATEDMVSGMIDAFRQGTDYMKVMEDSFDEMIDNMIVKTIAGQVIGKRINEIFERMGQETETLSAEDMAAYADELYATSAGAAEDFEKWMEALKAAGLDLQGASEEAADMSSLQKGIGTIQETTALALEAAANTLINNSFISNTIQTKISELSLQTLAVNSQILTALNIGNADRKAILESIRGMMNEDGRSLRVLI